MLIITLMMSIEFSIYMLDRANNSVMCGEPEKQQQKRRYHWALHLYGYAHPWRDRGESVENKLIQ